MASVINVDTRPAGTAEDHQTWATLYARQTERMATYAPSLFLEGFLLLGLRPDRLPEPAHVDRRLQTLTGWRLGEAQNAYLNATDWFEQIADRRFPVTDYIRKPDEIEFTPLPDLFHEYFGHLPFFTNQRFADLAHAFGPLYLAANERQQLEIARLWWFTTEFGLILEGGELKAFGAGLLSSISELDKAFHPTTRRVAFDMHQVTQTPSAVYEMHNIYFVLEDLEQIADVLRSYALQEGLPVPAAVR